MDVTALSRIQFALTAGFHYLYPPLSIGLSLVIVIMEGIYLKTKDPRFKKITIFWTRIFALSFALGVATGLVQLFAFGNNWARYSRFVGDVFGSALAAEGVFAFFLEAGFIGLMLFGWNKVRPGIHYLATICVAFGAHFSATWIVAANSWMQTPAGYKIEEVMGEARATLTDFWGMIFNPTFLDRLTHVLIGCWLTGAFMVISISAYYFLKKRHTDFAKVSLKVGLTIASVMVILQLVSADSSARKVAEYQPAKLAAMEGVYRTESHAAMNLIGWADSKTRTVKALQVPGLLSFLVYRNTETPVTGLDQFPEDDWPMVNAVFQTYHLMIYMWVGMFIAAVLGLILWKRKTFETGKWIHRYLVLSVFFPFVANEAGWFTAEMGRQPWIVYNVLRTADGTSLSIDRGQVIGSLIMFSFIYICLFSLFIFLLNRKIQHGPEETKEDIGYRDPYKLGAT
ncbi:Cytochrome bd ubiquinol oxidase subunit 1 [Candidatus Neptunochlamydia vexilliferae]|uniref:Cytochrome bd ubiquinol oxidase subunit 1 n=2 Tax=Candidatus Neptunichlamydia vexilliferae TaxID=1651774 RepID=A0ABS0AYN4_9BACT|nr:Cytochrome bd ubiquinol oxidase subunit 1 [Candidatus Neptunochlamydia vexilliferae]